MEVCNEKKKKHKSEQQGSEMEMKSLKWCNILHINLGTATVNGVMNFLQGMIKKVVEWELRVTRAVWFYIKQSRKVGTLRRCTVTLFQAANNLLFYNFFILTSVVGHWWPAGHAKHRTELPIL